MYSSNCSICSSNCCFFIYIQISQEAGQVVWYSHLFSYWRWWNSSWAISNPKRWCCESTALNMSAYLENSAVATALEKVSFNFNRKERQCQRMFKLLSNTNTKYWFTKQLVWLSIMCESKNYKWGKKEISKRSMLYIFTYRTFLTWQY